MITLTDNAIKEIKAILHRQRPPVNGLRIAIVAGEYSMQLESAAGALDTIFEHDGFSVFIDQLSLSQLKGAEVDYVEYSGNSEVPGFKFSNPNGSPLRGLQPSKAMNSQPRPYTQTMPTQLNNLTPEQNRVATTTMSLISLGETVTFPYDNVQYEAVVQRVNATNATMTLTKITGIPKREICVGQKVRVSGHILARSIKGEDQSR